MAEITAQAVNEFRKTTGLGLMECKALLKEADGDMKKALSLAKPALRKFSIAKSRLPLASVSAFLHSIMPAPVFSRRSLTIAGVIVINFFPFKKAANVQRRAAVYTISMPRYTNGAAAQFKR